MPTGQGDRVKIFGMGVLSSEEILEAALALENAARLQIAHRLYASVIPTGLTIEGQLDLGEQHSNELARRTEPDYGFFPWWPEDGDAWLYAEDVAIARSMIPSQQVWRRDVHPIVIEGVEYQVLRYGDIQIRVRQTLWRAAPHEGINLGDLVEVLPFGIKNEPQTGRIREVLIDEETLQLSYQITLGDGREVDKRFPAGDLRLLHDQGLREEKRIVPVLEEGEELELMED